MIIDWRLPELMRMRGLRSSAALARRLAERRGVSPGLSQAQVYRLVEDAPERLNLATLEALCLTLETTPAELLTSDVAGVPNRLLQTLLSGFAVSAAHHNLCQDIGVEPSRMMSHPGDPFGKVVAWLWSSGRRDLTVVCVTDYLAEMRRYNPHAPEEGDRLTWEQLKVGIKTAINAPYDLSPAAVEELCAYLESNVPGHYGTSLSELNTP